MSISKKELIKRVSQRVNHHSQDVEEVINATLDEIYQSLKQGESVSLRDFVLSIYKSSEKQVFSNSILLKSYESYLVGHQLIKEKFNSVLNWQRWGQPFGKI